MENGLQLFSNSELGQVRVIIDENNEPWFVAKDVAEALGYQWSGIRNVQHIPEEWRLVESVSTSFGDKQTWFLSEQGLYFFLGRSDKPKALPFQKWLAGEVLPTIRKTGSYGVQNKMPTHQEALRGWADALDKLAIAESERDEAIRTKAYISNKREASVMGKLSGMSKKVAALEDRLGEGANWKACTAIPWLDAWFDVKRPGFYSQLGRYLTKLSVALGYETGTVEHPKYGTVKAYHTDVIYELSVRLTNGVVILPKYHIDD